MTPAAGWWTLVGRLGEAQVLLPAVLAAAAWLAWRGGAPRKAAGWLAAIGVAAALTTATKLAFIGWGVGSAALDFTGISGHAMFAAAILPVLLGMAASGSRTGRSAGGAAAGLALAALIAVSRVVTGAHSASEAAAGFALGAAAAAALLAHGGPPPRGRPARWLALPLAAWLLLVPAGMPPSRTHDAVTRLALALSGRAAPCTRADLHRDTGCRPSPLPKLDP